MKIWTFEGGFDNNFTYLFSDGVSPDAAIVDASVPLNSLKSTIEKNSLTPSKLLLTHTHFDHTHTQDSTCFHVQDALFSGDTIFVGRTGRTIGAGSDTRQLYRSISGKLLTLSGNTTIYSGHDYGPVQKISMKENIEMSPLLQATDEDDFVRKMEEYERSR